MKSVFKQLMLIYFIIVIVKTILSYFIPAPSSFGDAYLYIRVAREFFFNGNFLLQGFPVQYPPLYSLVLSVAFLFKDMQIVFFLMKFLNAIFSTLIIFPTFLLAKEFLDNYKSKIVTILVVLLPSTFSFSPYIMAENLFYPIFMFSIFFIYKSFTEKDIFWDILAGVFIGLSYLTKVNGLVLLFPVLVLLLYKLFKKDYHQILKKSILLLIVLALIFLNFTRGYYQGVSNNLLNTISIPLMSLYLLWFVLYIGLIVLSSGIIFLIFSLFNKENKIFNILYITTFIGVILVAVNHNIASIILTSHATGDLPTFSDWAIGRPYGRYIDEFLPLIFIAGAAGINNIKRKKIVFPIIITSIILSISVLLTNYSLFPVNNLSTSFLGILSFLKIPLFPILVILPFIFLIPKRLNFKKIFSLFIVFFLLVSLLNFSIAYYDSDKFWYQEEQMQLGLWMNDNIPKDKIVLFDDRDCGRITKYDQSKICEKHDNIYITIIGTWLINKIIVGDISTLDGDYIISKHILPYTKIKETKSGTYLYKK